jgi:hypothetical protein
MTLVDMEPDAGVLRKREEIARLAEVMLARPEIHVETPVRHHFAPGVYAREMTIPRGTVVVGKIHKTLNLFIMVSGDLEVSTPDGPPVRLTGYNVLMTTPGTQRAVYAHEDSIVLNIHPTDETDLGKIEDQVIAKSFDEIDMLDAMRRPALARAE